MTTCPTAFWKGAVVSVLCMLCLYYNDLYDLTVVRTTREVFIRLLQSVGSALILIALLYLVAPWLMVADGASLPAFALFLTSILAWRLVFNHFTRLRSFGERVLIVGTDTTAQTIARQIRDQEDFAYDVVGFIDDDASRVLQSIGDWRVVGTPDDIERVDCTLRGRSTDRRHVRSPRTAAGARAAAEQAARASGSRTSTRSTNGSPGNCSSKICDPSWLIFSDDYSASRWTRRSKRIFDAVLAFVGLVVSTPFRPADRCRGLAGVRLTRSCIDRHASAKTDGSSR